MLTSFLLHGLESNSGRSPGSDTSPVFRRSTLVKSIIKVFWALYSDTIEKESLSTMKVVGWFAWWRSFWNSDDTDSVTWSCSCSRHTVLSDDSSEFLRHQRDVFWIHNGVGLFCGTVSLCAIRGSMKERATRNKRAWENKDSVNVWWADELILQAEGKKATSSSEVGASTKGTPPVGTVFPWYSTSKPKNEAPLRTH